MNKLKTKKVKGIIQTLKVLPYRECPVYIRVISGTIFTYDLIFKNELYSSYIIIRPRKGQTKLSDTEISQAGALIMTGAMTTIDTMLGTKLDKKTEEVVKTVEANREKLDKKELN